MPKKEYMCWECDTTFTVVHQRGYDVTYCPFCAEEISEKEDSIEYEEE